MSTAIKNRTLLTCLVSILVALPLKHLFGDKQELVPLVTAIAVTPDGTRAVVGSNYGSLSLWNLTSFHMILQYAGFHRHVEGIAFDMQGEGFMATAPTEPAANLFNISEEEPLARLPVKSANFEYNAFTYGCQNAIVWGSHDGTVRRYVPKASSMEEYLGHHTPVTAIAESPDCRSIVAGAIDGNVLLWTLNRGGAPKRALVPAAGERDPIVSVSFAPDSAQFAVASFSGRVSIFGVDGSLKSAWQESQKFVSAAAMSSAGQLLVAPRRGVRVYDLRTGEFLGSIGDAGVLCLAIKGDRAYLGGTDVEVWSISDRKQLGKFRITR